MRAKAPKSDSIHLLKQPLAKYLGTSPRTPRTPKQALISALALVHLGDRCGTSERDPQWDRGRTGHHGGTQR